MDFSEMYELIKEKGQLSYYISKGKKFLQNKNIDINENYLGLQVTNKCYNSCEWCCINASSKGQEMELSLILPKLSSFKNVCLTGGEPLIYSKFPYFLKAYKESSNDKKYLSIMSAGMNPKAAPKDIELYYSNLELVFDEQAKSKEDESSNLYSSISYSFHFSGIEPIQRLENFLLTYKEMTSKHKKVLPLFFTIIHENEIDKKEKQVVLSEIYEEVVGIKLKESLVESGVIINYNKHTGQIKNDKKCFISNKNNYLFFKQSGDLGVCCSQIESMISLPKAGNISEDLGILFEKKFVYMGLIDEFQDFAKDYSYYKNDTCITCTKIFPQFLESKKEELINE